MWWSPFCEDDFSGEAPAVQKSNILVGTFSSVKVLQLQISATYYPYYILHIFSTILIKNIHKRRNDKESYEGEKGRAIHNYSFSYACALDLGFL